MKKNVSNILAAFLCCNIFLLLNGCLQRDSTYGVIDTPVVSSDGKYIACIVAESVGLTHQENGGYRKTNYSTSYWLKKYETATGKLLEKKKLLDHTDNPDICCYGSFDNKIWLYVNGIEAYDINNLEKLTGEKEIAADNGVKKTLFPYGSRLVNPSVENGYIDFITDNSEQYRLQLRDLKIINKKEIKDSGTEKRSIDLRHDDDYGTRCDTFSNNMFAFAYGETSAMEARPGSYGFKESAYRMKLFKGSYIVKPLGNHNSFSYQNIALVGNSSYLNPCFAINTSNGDVIHLSKPDGFILIQQDTLGEKSKAIITRIDTDGKKVWETAAGISTKIETCIMKDKYCIITANKAYMLSPHIGKDALCIVDIETGNIIKPVIGE